MISAGGKKAEQLCLFGLKSGPQSDDIPGMALLFKRFCSPSDTSISLIAILRWRRWRRWPECCFPKVIHATLGETSMLPFQILCILGALIALVCSGCATTHQGEEQSFQGATAAVSCAEDERYRTNHFASIVCTFENTGDEWRNFEIVSLSPGNGARVLDPAQTKLFVQARTFKAAKDNHNDDVALIMVGLGGLLAAGTSDNRWFADAGIGVVTVSAATATGRALMRDKHDVENASVSYGPNHILSGGILVPPELFVRRALIVEFAGKNDIPGCMNICFKSPAAECREIVLPVRLDQMKKRQS